MKTFLLFLGFSFLTARAEEIDPGQAARTIIENEGKFFQMAQEQNTRAAFLTFLAEDSIVFNPGLVDGKATWSKRPEEGISIKWKPEFAGMSRSADLGYTTGPAEWRRNKDDTTPYGYGQFVSIWRKEKDGSWKVALDVGNEVPGARKTEANPEIEYWISQGSEPGKELREAERLFAIAAKGDSTIALTEASVRSVRVHREGVYPAVGKEAARLMLSVRRGRLSLERLGGGMSGARDLAYSYGKYTLDKPQTPERGHYLQIWRVDDDGAWKIALDYQTPLPAGEKKK